MTHRLQSVSARFGRNLRAALVLTPLALSLPATAQDTWHVAAGAVPGGSGTALSPFATVAAGIGAAVDGDTVLVGPGTYVELVDFAGKSIAVRSSDGPEVTTLDGGVGVFTPFMSTVRIASGEDSSTLLQGFRITGGFGTLDETFTSAQGGGVFLEATSPTLRDLIVEQNQAEVGAGVYSNGGSPLLEDVILRDHVNFGQSMGGGGYFRGGAPELRNTHVESNVTGIAGGGLMFVDSDPLLEGGAVVGNFTSCPGGGVQFEGSTLASVVGTRFESNTTSDHRGGGINVGPGADVTLDGAVLANNVSDNDHAGGAIYVEAGASLTLIGVELRDNVSARGGAVATEGTLAARDSRFQGNTSKSYQALDGTGGAVWVSPLLSASNTSFEGCVFVGNEASEGPSGGGDGGAIFGPATIDHCSFSGNTATGLGGGAWGAQWISNSIHHGNQPAALSGAASVSYSNVEGGVPGLGNVDLDPLFWSAATGDLHLLLGSPCIDAAGPGSPADADGSPADMGALPHEGSHTLAYCTAGVSAAGCTAALSAGGLPSATASSGFTLALSGVEGQRKLLFFYGANGRQITSWGTGTSFQCVAPPVKRGAVLSADGTSGACDGTAAYDLNALWCSSCPRPGHNPGAGAIVQAQAWYRDPASTSNQSTSLSDALEFQVQP